MTIKKDYLNCGIIATAYGFAKGLSQPTTLLIGDLAFLHDLNSLSLAASATLPFVIVVFNNNGGGIFSFLPISRFPDVLEKYFTTPHNLSFDKAAEMFKMDYAKPESLEGFTLTYQAALKRKQVTLIEVVTNRDKNYQLQKELLHTPPIFSGDTNRYRKEGLPVSAR